jgi:NAD+ kinase
MTQTPPPWPVSGQAQLSRIGVVVHPSRDVDGPVGTVTRWARKHGVELVELPGAGEPRTGFPRADFGDCDLAVAIGGDGTALGAIRDAARAERLVLGVACGSLGALTAVTGAEFERALERCAAGDFERRPVAALVVAVDGGEDRLAYNDIAVIRHGDGQVRVSAVVNGALYARLAGDGCIVSTAQGSSAYTVAAGGPLLDPNLEAFVFTPLPTHGGYAPPLVLAAAARLELELTSGHGGTRLEVDGHGGPTDAERLTVTLRPSAAFVITFSDGDSHLTGLRRRGILADSPRILADERRKALSSSGRG